MAEIHKTALVDSSAEVADDVAIGAYTVVERGVRIDSGCRIGRHNVIGEGTTIGKENAIGDFNSIGAKPFDKKYRSETASLVLGRRNTIHAFCTLCIGTKDGGGATRLGDENWLMAYVHLAHDSQTGSGNVLSNSVQVAGHVEIGDQVTLGGGVLVHQRCRIGALAMMSAGTYLTMDMPPYFTAGGANGRRMSVNSIGLERAGMTAAEIQAANQAFATLYRKGHSLEQAVLVIDSMSETYGFLGVLADFLRKEGRGILRPPPKS